VASRLVKLVLLAMWTVLCAFIAVKMALQRGWIYAILIGALTAYLVWRVAQEIRSMRAGEDSPAGRKRTS
jgi:threonine/homoserine/homoserine lactone efflux protein